MRRVSGPLLDRIDLRVVMPRMEAEQLVEAARPEASELVAQRIGRAWLAAQSRNAGRSNAQLKGQLLLDACAMDRATRTTLKDVAHGLDLTARGVHRILRVARTIADLGQREAVAADEILAAASLRDRLLETELAA